MNVIKFPGFQSFFSPNVFVCILFILIIFSNTGLADEISEENALISAVDKVSPSVVSINTIIEGGGAAIFDPLEFELYYVPREGQGSGVIVDEKGYVITNAHVVNNSEKIFVTLSDGREFEGTLIGSDPYLDLALIHINGENLPVASLGNSDKLKPGSWAIAIGNPYGFSNTVTIGFISAVNRNLRIDNREFQGLIQTDAAINPGNSGGALVNIYGELIGINIAIVSYAQGIGFAIPSNDVRDLMEELIEYGKISRAYVGFYTNEVTLQIAAKLGLPDARGLIVTEIISDGPGDRAGLKVGDVIRQVNGKDVNKVEDFNKLLIDIDIGNLMELYVYRAGYYGKLYIFIEED